MFIAFGDLNMDLKTQINLFFSIVFVVLVSYRVEGQDTISFINPSFEDFPRANKPPHGWSDCGFPGETPPDVQPSGVFGVFWPAMEGNTYLGMVARANETYETVGQVLPRSLMAGTCYQVSMFICKSSVYYSALSDKKEEGIKNFISPIKLRIWGGYELCEKKELLGETTLVTNQEWEKKYVKLSPRRGDYKVIFLEAYYNTPVLFPYNGNILVDDLSHIVEMGSCQDSIIKDDPMEGPLVEILDPAVKIDPDRRLYRINGKAKNVFSKQKIYLAVNDLHIKNYTFIEKTGEFSALVILSEGKNEIKLIGSNSVGTDTDSTVINIGIPRPQPSAPAIVQNDSAPPTSLYHNAGGIEIGQYTFSSRENKKVLKPGDIIQLDHLQFKANSSEIENEEVTVLVELLKLLQEYPTLKVEIGGHTNSKPDWDICMKLSSERALAVANFLIKNGIAPQRLRTVGYGKKYPIASNKTPEGRKKNQRVELKILDI